MRTTALHCKRIAWFLLGPTGNDHLRQSASILALNARAAGGTVWASTVWVWC